jgi:hypothetical protein
VAEGTRVSGQESVAVSVTGQKYRTGSAVKVARVVTLAAWQLEYHYLRQFKSKILGSFINVPYIPVLVGSLSSLRYGLINS